MDTLIGIRGADFVLCAADATVNYSILRLSTDCDKLYEVDGDKILGCCGDTADRENFAEYLVRNLHLLRLRNHGVGTSPHAAAHAVRTELAQALRRNPFQVNTLVAGVNSATGAAELYWVDYLGTLATVPTAAQGLGSNFVYGLLDKKYKADLTLEEAKELMRECLETLRVRLVLDVPKYVVKVATKDGVQAVQL